jgi:PKD repeat protein
MQMSSFLSRRGVRSAAPVALGAVCLVALALSATSHAVDPAPGVKADFKWTPAIPVVGQTVQFESTSQVTGVANRIANYRWDLDGDLANGFELDTGTAPTASAVYPVRGPVAVRLRVQDILGHRNTIQKTATVAGQAPVASFTFTPVAPVANQPVTFTSTSKDPDGTLAEQVWDMNGDGLYDDGGGPTALRTFAAPGAYVVGLRVTDNEGAVSFYSQSIIVNATPAVALALAPAQPILRLLSPFPIVRIAGRVTRHGARVKLFQVDAPPGSTVIVKCKGRGCRFKSTSRMAAWQPSVTASSVVRLHSLERHLGGGVKVRVFVTSRNAIGKYTSFKIRRGKTPLRYDACLMPGSYEPVGCPGAV